MSRDPAHRGGTRTLVANRTRLPEPGRPQPFRFPTIRKSVLQSGLRVWTVNHAANPIVNLIVLVRRGAADDPSGHEGLAAVTIDMLDEGSGGRNAIDMHEALARLGAHLDSDIGSDAALLSATVLSRFAEPAITLLADMVARPSLLEPDFVRVRDLRLHRLTQLRDLPGAVADRAFMRLLYGGNHPYGHTPLGDERSLNALSLDDVRRFHASAIRPSETTIIAVGDCDHETIERFVDTAFAGWTTNEPRGTVAPATLPVPPRLNVVPRAGAPQSELRIGHVAVARDTPDYHALIATNMVLGGQFVSRINLNLREDKGLTYGARTAFDFRRLPGPFALHVSVQTEATGEAIHESIEEIAGIRGPRTVTPEELALSVAALTRGYARGFETPEQIGRAITQIALYDLRDTYFDEFVPRVAAVTVDDVMRVAAAHLDPSRLTTLVVGDLDVIGDDLTQLQLGALNVLSANAF